MSQGEKPNGAVTRSGSRASGDDRQLQSALARISELEQQLLLTTQAQTDEVEELRRRIAWYETHELDIEPIAARHGLLQRLIGGWAAGVRLVRQARNQLARRG